MLFTTKMKQLVAVVLDRDAEKVTRELLNQSLLHFVKIKEIVSEWRNKLADLEPQVSLAMLGELRNRVESFLGIIHYYPSSGAELDINKLQPIDLDATKKTLDKLAERLQVIRERQRLLQQEILKYGDIKRQLELFGDLGAGIKASSRYSFLSIQTGTIKASLTANFEKTLGELPSVVLNFQQDGNLSQLLIISMKKDDARVNAILEKFGWTDIDLSGNVEYLSENVQTDISGKLAAFTREQAELKIESDNLIAKDQDRLKELWQNIRMNELYYKIQSYFSKTSRTVVFSGWLPADKQATLEKAIRQATDGCCYLEWNTPADLPETERKKMNVPVKFQNPKFLAPFQMLVSNYSIPEYGTIDPTPFVAIAYLMMFGLMFGDVGQGIVLMLTGFLGQWIYQGKSLKIRQLLQLISWCGGAAIVAGVLFGSYFGFPWIKPLWFDYHGIVAGHAPPGGPVLSIYGILAITIYFGIFIIGFGLLLHWINLVAARKWFNLLFNKGGVLGVWMYAGGLYTAFYFAEQSYRTFPPGSQLFWLFAIPAILFMLKPPLEFIIHKRHDPKVKFTPLTPVDFLMEWIVEMMEIFSGYLANTLSFMRVAGLGIAHTSLMIAFFEMAKMANNGSAENFGFWPILLLVTGNILVIVLEGLSAGIQSLRLNYYEFFSKYFSGSGKAYAPVSLRVHE